MKSPSDALLKLIAEWIAEAKALHPGSLNSDGTGLMIYGDVGGAAYVRADGSIEIEPWDEFPENAWHSDTNFVYAALVAAAKKRPALAELLPDRHPGALDCTDCSGSGSLMFGSSELGCASCYGLGWHLYVDPPNPTVVYHNGWWHGNNAVFRRLLSDTATIIILGNKFNSNIWQAGKLSAVFTDIELPEMDAE